MSQAGIIIALILLSIGAEMVKGSKRSKASKQSKAIQYNTIQYSTIQYNPIQYNSITREYRTRVRSRPLRKEKAPGIRKDTGGSKALIPLSRSPGSPGPDNRC